MTLNQMVEQIEESKRTSAKKLLAQLAWMERTLKTLRAEVDALGVTEEFVQGKQHFRREQPALKSYTSLVARYATIHRQIVSMLPKGVELDEDELDAWAREYEDK